MSSVYISCCSSVHVRGLPDMPGHAGASYGWLARNLPDICRATPLHARDDENDRESVSLPHQISHVPRRGTHGPETSSYGARLSKSTYADATLRCGSPPPPQTGSPPRPPRSKAYRVARAGGDEIKGSRKFDAKICPVYRIVDILNSSLAIV